MLTLVDLSALYWPCYFANGDAPGAFDVALAQVQGIHAGNPRTIVCCEGRQPFRYEIDPAYKSNRPPRPEAAREALAALIGELCDLGIPIVSVDHMEADDTIATLATNAKEPVEIIGQDKDLMALLSPTVSMVINGKVCGPDHCLEKFGVHPHQIRDYLAICGDASDNIKGCPGIGGKGAARLLQKFGSLDAIRAAADEELELGPKTLAKFRAWDPTLAVKLVSLLTTAPITIEEIIPTESTIEMADMTKIVTERARGPLKILAYGPEGCLASDTFVRYEIHANGRRSNHKGGTIERLYERFNGIPAAPGAGVGKYQRPETIGAEFFAPSMNEEGRIVQNKITAVIDSGVKEVLELTTWTGATIRATRDHKFFDGERYVELGELQVGGQVMIHNSTPFKCEDGQDRAAVARAECYVKHHPVAPIKRVNSVINRQTGETREYNYHVLRRSRAVVEANMNGIELEEYVARLNDNALDGLAFLDPADQVHHRDEDVTNDALDNLEVLRVAEHARVHAEERHNNLRFTAIPDEIVSIVSVGQTRTYDIQMADPYRNFVANQFVVHNCGKTRFGAFSIKPIFLCAENGLSGPDLRNVPSFPPPENWNDAIDAVKYLTTAQHDHKTLVVDSLDWLHQHARAAVCRRENMSPSQYEDYGRGEKHAFELWVQLMAALSELQEKRGMHVVMLAHSAMETFQNPQGEDFVRYQLALSKKAAERWKQWPDFLLFMSQEMFTKKSKDDKAAKGIIGDYRIFTTRSAAFDAKNRINLPTEIAYETANPWRPFIDAVKEIHQAAAPATAKAEPANNKQEAAPAA